jgi:tripartite ATP-independent transporter DctM subunit
MSIELITLLMFGMMLLLLATGLPIVFVLGGLALFFGILMWGSGSMYVVVANANQTMRSNILVAIPLFVFMAFMLEGSGVGEELYKAIHLFMGSLNGGLAASTVLGCTLIAAMSGVSGTGVLLMGIIGIPAMQRRNYDIGLAMGSIMAGSALGVLIPPSVIMIVYALMGELSVGKLFLGGVIPGLLLSFFFVIYILLRCYFNPRLGPALPPEERATWIEKVLALKGVILPILLVVAVLGSIFAGFATPTEAAAVGALGTLILVAFRRKLNLKIIKDTAYRTLKTVAMIMWIIFGATCFATIYQGIGAGELIQNLLKSWPVSKWVILIMIQITWLILGCLMDGLSILMITGPIFIPVANFLGFDPLWFGIVFVVNSEMGYLTPPFGVNLFVMRGIAPEGINMGDIYRCVWPFVTIQAIGLVVVILIPQLATWLPNLIVK